MLKIIKLTIVFLIATSLAFGGFALAQGANPTGKPAVPPGLVDKIKPNKEVVAERKRIIEEQKSLTIEEKKALKERKVEDRFFMRGEKLVSDVPPVIKGNRTLVPTRAITEGLGATVEWLEEERKVIITKEDKVITLQIDSSEVYVNGELYELDVPAQLISNRTMVPIRFLSEIFGVSVDYDEETGDIDIGLEDELLEENDDNNQTDSAQ